MGCGPASTQRFRSGRIFTPCSRADTYTGTYAPTFFVQHNAASKDGDHKLPVKRTRPSIETATFDRGGVGLHEGQTSFVDPRFALWRLRDQFRPCCMRLVGNPP